MPDLPSSVPAPGTELGSYRIERRLGGGGMGTVYLAYDTTLHRQVALKVLTESDADQTSGRRLLHEARNAAALNHPKICTIYEVGEAHGRAFIAMEYVDGASLRDRLDAGALTCDEAVHYGLEAAEALAYAHSRGVEHRDFKAANVMVTRDGGLKVVDFGLSRRADPAMAEATTLVTLVPRGTVAGTPYAMAPEQVRGEPTDARTDIWALGILLYEMAAGVKPFDAPSAPEIFTSVLRDPPGALPANVPMPLRRVIERCLEKAPERRYQDADAVRAELRAIEAGRPLVGGGIRARVGRRRWILAGAVAAIGALLVGFGAGAVRERLLGWLPSTPARLAVLPFENLTGDPEQEYFSDGLTEEIITQLGRLQPRQLSVIARTSSARYKNARASIDQIGRELGADYIMEGSARREGSQVRISATLIRARDQTQLWSDTFERELSGMLSLENDVARGIADSLQLTLLPDERSRLATDRPVNAEAYEAYLKGLSLEDNLTPANLTNALKYFELARDKDPGYAAPYAGIAGVWFARHQVSLASREEAEPKLQAAVQKALALDDTLADAHFRLAEQDAWMDWNWEGADREFRRAIELNPNQALTRSTYADLLTMVKRPEEALAQIRKAMELDPVSTETQAFYGRVLMFTRRFDESIAQYRATLRRAPDQQLALANIRLVLHESGRYDEALAADRVWAASPGNPGGPDLVDALARGDEEAGYQGAMRRAADVLARRGNRPFMVAQFYMRAGEKALALDWLERGFQSHDVGMLYLNVAAIWDPLRDEPRFQALIRQLKLPV
jgi:TolB-like protein/predicted Ser/Thr protein kinase